MSWAMLLTTSVKVVPVTMSLLSVNVTPLAMVTPPLFKNALLIVLGPMTAMSPNTAGSPVPLAVPSLMAPPFIVAPPVNVRVVPSSIWMVAPLAVSEKVVPFTVSLSSVRTTPLAIVTPP